MSIASGFIEVILKAPSITLENIGARRLYTILEKVFEELSFNAPDQKTKEIKIDKSFVKNNLDKFVNSADISRYVL